MLDIIASYDAIRTAAGVYRRGTEIVRIVGTERMQLATRLLAKSIEFVAVDSCVDSLLLDEDGQTLGLTVALLRNDEILLVVEGDVAWFDLAERISADFDATVTRDKRIAIAIEGPKAWQIAAPLVIDREIADVLLGEVLDGAFEGSPVILARTGTTAEFGYLVIAAEEALTPLVTATETIDGGEIDPAVLTRVRVETNYTVFPQQFAEVSLLEAGLGWFVTLEREDEFIGAAVIDTEVPTRRVIAAEIEGDCPEINTEVRDEDKIIGRVLVSTERAGREYGLALLLLDDPYGVPGLEVDIDGHTAFTRARPTIAPSSWDAQIGVK